MTSVATHIGCLMLGGFIGIMAMAVLAASGRDVVTCKHCKHSGIEKHTGDEVLTCWVRRTYGEAVQPDHFCSYGEVGE